jgi:uncharacterized membrane protein YhiD involved in acid resistance
MEWTHFLSTALASESHNFAIFDLVVAILLSACLMAPVAWVYRYTQSHNNFAPSFVQSLFLFSCLTSVFTLIIGSNVARAFGLIGALSIIRFRNALKEPVDAVYIFWALAIGMSCGCGLYFTAAVMTALCAAIALTLHWLGIGQAYYHEAVIKLQGNREVLSKQKIEELMRRNAKSFYRVDSDFEGSSGLTEWTYAVKTRQDKHYEYLHRNLSNLPGIRRIRIIKQPSGLFVE